VLRCALVPELRDCCGMLTPEIAMCFKHQPDFDYGTSLKQVKSLIGYNRYTCQKIRQSCGYLIDDICKQCKRNKNE
jgi:hypothetical protein